MPQKGLANIQRLKKFSENAENNPDNNVDVVVYKKLLGGTKRTKIPEKTVS